MAIKPNQNSPQDGGNESGRDWEKLSPAVKPASSAGSKAQKISAAPFRSQSNIVAPNPAPWTSSIQRVAALQPEHAATPPVEPSVESPRSSRVESAADSAPDITDESRSTRRTTEQISVDPQDKPFLLAVRCIIIALAVPVVTFMIAVRAVATSTFLSFEYNRPGFPADSYGFDTVERMRLGSYGLDYILNLAPESYLMGIRTDGAVAFLQAEVEHMTDVKRVFLYALVFTVTVLVLALLSAYTLPSKAPGTVSSSLFTGSWLTLILLMVLGVSGLLGWDTFFTTFHEIFFPQGNWQFRPSDTLIRLYPPQFWKDAALAACALVVLMVAVILVCTWPTTRRQAAHKRRAEKQRA